MVPVEEYAEMKNPDDGELQRIILPSCPYCVPKYTHTPPEQLKAPCPQCGAMRLRLMEFTNDQVGRREVRRDVRRDVRREVRREVRSDPPTTLQSSRD